MNAPIFQAVPHLTTASNGPLHQIESRLLTRQTDIETWFRQRWLQTPAPFYASVDLRNAGFKLAPVDTNLFPAGFNNLNPAFFPLAIHAVQSAMERLCPNACDILLVPENHTRNLYYLDSVATLKHIIEQAGYKVRIGSLLPDIGSGMTIDNLPSGRSLQLEPLLREGNRLKLQDYNPCVVLLNNDLSGGRPPILENLEQIVIPPLALGWINRLKSQHFAIYHDLATEFAELIDIDPWFIDPLFRNCGQIDFMSREGTECLEHAVGELLASIGVKYRKNGIDRKPHVFVKADAGTYGMGIMSVSSVDEIRHLNRKQRTSMSSAKEGLRVQRVLIQEGVYTSETIGENASAEPVVYMVGHYVIGGFYRVHSQKTSMENLNSPGMHFEPLAFVEPCNVPDKTQQPDAIPNRFYAYGAIARLALLAAAKEIAQQSTIVINES
ncbi:MAG: glutamate--cysteine ligase [Gammaproteobacteria bacterium]|nr:glutamate--cysteine ligase [Gammaproteobacteria bacterium]